MPSFPGGWAAVDSDVVRAQITLIDKILATVTGCRSLCSEPYQHAGDVVRCASVHSLVDQLIRNSLVHGSEALPPRAVRFLLRARGSCHSFGDQPCGELDSLVDLKHFPQPIARNQQEEIAGLQRAYRM